MNSYVFINGVEIHKLKAKDSEINAYLLSLDNAQTFKRRNVFFTDELLTVELFITL